MKQFVVIFIAWAGTACDRGLADLWNAPVKRVSSRATPQARVPHVRMLSDRLGVVVNTAPPTRVAPTPDERINVMQSAPLGDDLWVVRTRVRTGLGSGAPSRVRWPDGRRLSDALLEKALEGAPQAVLGLRLDDRLHVVADSHNKGRRGKLVQCDGDWVADALALRACLVLAASRGAPVLVFEPEELAKDAGVPLVDATIPLDAAVAGQDGGVLR